MNHQEGEQTIVIENLLYIPHLDYETSLVKITTFTKDVSEGRYRFLMDVQ